MKSIVVLSLTAAAAAAAAALLAPPALGARNAQRIRVFQAVLIAGQETAKPDSAALGLGFWWGYRTLERRVLAKYGGLKVY